MGRRCCITGCNSTSRLPEHHGVTYHSFPLDSAVRQLWVRHTRLSSERNITKSVLVCSRHFRRVDFQPQRSGKYLLKQRVFPTVFPWGKVDPAQVEADQEELAQAAASGSSTCVSVGADDESGEDSTKATVEATVAQIMAEAALNSKKELSNEAGDAQGGSTSMSGAVKFEPVTNFSPGVRLEAQDFDGVWHLARIVEVDNDDREVLIKFERSGKTKSAIVGTEEWIPMNSNRLRQKISTKPIPVFALEEKCMARWSGPRKFPGTVKKLLGNDTYEILFDDGYVKNVRAVHMSKVLSSNLPQDNSVNDVSNVSLNSSMEMKTENTGTPHALTMSDIAMTSTPTTSKAVKRSFVMDTSVGTAKKRATPGSRKDWPLLDLAKLDLTSLNLPEIPHDGEWTCHWVNDQPIGREGFLIVGEHRKLTVIVDDWRLPPGWVKHMYQRSNVLGKWDVILVSPKNKRFRSKADLKVYLEEQGLVYNPDIYDFSIHRRRAKDINAYVYTPDYTPQPAHKFKSMESLNSPTHMEITSPSLPTAKSTSSPTDVIINTAAMVSSLTNSSMKYMEAPVATATPPLELMTTTSSAEKNEQETSSGLNVSKTAEITMPAVAAAASTTATDNGYAYIGGLKVQIIDNLFRCPQEGCFKNFRKENHLQIHVKHYHQDLVSLLGDCPKMQELAEKRTHPISNEQQEPLPKNQIPNQQFFAKLHQQDLEHTRAHRRSTGAAATATSTGSTNSSALAPVTSIAATTPATIQTTEAIPLQTSEIKEEKPIINETNIDDAKMETSLSEVNISLNTTESSTIQPNNASLMSNTSTVDESADLSGIQAAKRSRFSPTKRAPAGSRKSNRQRTTKRYLTAAQATAGAAAILHSAADSSFGASDFEETRHSFNATPDVKPAVSHSRRSKQTALATPIGSVDSPLTADSGSSSMQACYGGDSLDVAPSVSGNQPHYIKENGELIKIVRMRQEEVINCLCSYGEEDGLMIQCELCLCWQHGICNGIDKEADVPDKYVCYICRNPQRARDSLRYKHDQDWLYDGKLPSANYHMTNPELLKRFDFLKKSHTLTGNLIELKQFMHSLRVKINIANNRCHPKLYLWAKKWDEEASRQLEMDIKQEDIKTEDAGNKFGTAVSMSPSKKVKAEPVVMPNIPLPEAAIDPVECQHRLLEHVKFQQSLVMQRLNDIESEIDDLEKQDELPDLKQADISQTKDILAMFIKELDTLKQISKLNSLEHNKRALQQKQLFIK